MEQAAAYMVKLLDEPEKGWRSGRRASLDLRRESPSAPSRFAPCSVWKRGCAALRGQRRPPPADETFLRQKTPALCEAR